VNAIEGAIRIVTPRNANIQVYNVLGQSVASVRSTGTANVEVGKGIYIVNITTAEGEKLNTKVLVK
jgi:hypothetical protein